MRNGDRKWHREKPSLNDHHSNKQCLCANVLCFLLLVFQFEILEVCKRNLTTNFGKIFFTLPLDNGRKLNVHKTSSRRLMYLQLRHCAQRKIDPNQEKGKMKKKVMVAMRQELKTKDISFVNQFWRIISRKLVISPFFF